MDCSLLTKKDKDQISIRFLHIYYHFLCSGDFDFFKFSFNVGFNKYTDFLDFLNIVKKYERSKHKFYNLPHLNNNQIKNLVYKYNIKPSYLLGTMNEIFN